MWLKIAVKWLGSNTASFVAWLLPLVIGIATDPQQFLSSHPWITATYAAVVMIGQGCYKLWTIYQLRHTATPALIPPAPVPANQPPAAKAAAHAQPLPSKRK
jgi:hypothetical protein